MTTDMFFLQRIEKGKGMRARVCVSGWNARACDCVSEWNACACVRVRAECDNGTGDLRGVGAKDLLAHNDVHGVKESGTVHQTGDSTSREKKTPPKEREAR